MLASLPTVMFALALTATSPAAPEWEPDYGKALKQTRSDSRPLLIVLDKPGTEGQQAAEELLDAASEKNESADLLSKYDLCRVDASTEYGQAVAEAFGAEAFPYAAIIDKTGSVVLHSQSGQLTGDDWQATLAKHQTGERAQRVTVMKPVSTTVDLGSETVIDGSSVVEAMPSYATPTRGYCPSCQRNR